MSYLVPLWAVKHSAPCVDWCVPVAGSDLMWSCLEGTRGGRVQSWLMSPVTALQRWNVISHTHDSSEVSPQQRALVCDRERGGAPLLFVDHTDFLLWAQPTTQIHCVLSLTTYNTVIDGRQKRKATEARQDDCWLSLSCQVSDCDCQCHH